MLGTCLHGKHPRENVNTKRLKSEERGDKSNEKGFEWKKWGKDIHAKKLCYGGTD